MSATVPAARQQRSRRTERRLLDAGFAVLERDGPEGLTIAAVSSRAGVSAGTVYRRFGDKEGLLTAIQAEFADGVREEFARQMALGGDPTTPLQAVDAAVRGLAASFRAHEPMLRVFAMLGQRDERVFRVGSEASRRGADHFRDLLWPHRRAFTSDRPEHAIDLAYRQTYAVLLHRVVNGPHLESDTDQTWDELTDELSRVVALQLLGTLPRSALE